MTQFEFFLGTHAANWLWAVEDVPLFVSYRRLKRRKTPFPRATTRWAMDSGGFTELSNPPEGSPQTVWHDCPNNLPIPEVRWPHRWQVTPEEYVANVRRFANELGNLQWAAPQDWMCEPWILRDTGLTVEEHQRRTIHNGMLLREIGSDLPFIYAVQGWTVSDYHRHIDMYAEAGIDLTKEPIVGVGSVCRRESTAEAEAIFESIARRGITIHGFGVKTGGLTKYDRHLISSDSLAWSYGARRDQVKLDGCTHRGDCRNCLHFAVEWHRRVLNDLANRPDHYQLSFDDLGATA